MRIAIICSLAFADKAGEVKKQLEAFGHIVSLPFTVADILAGKTTVETIAKEKSVGTFAERAQKNDLIRKNFERQKQDDVVVVVTGTKNGIANYIGANTFLEVGFGYVLGMPVYFWDDIPTSEFFRDELAVMAPTALHGDPTKIASINTN